MDKRLPDVQWDGGPGRHDRRDVVVVGLDRGGAAVEPGQDQAVDQEAGRPQGDVAAYEGVLARRDGDGEDSVLSKAAAKPSQRRANVVQVLEDVGALDDVVEPEVELHEVAAHPPQGRTRDARGHLLTVLHSSKSVLERLGPDVRCGHLVACFEEADGVLAGAGADVEDAGRGREAGQDAIEGEFTGHRKVP